MYPNATSPSAMAEIAGFTRFLNCHLRESSHWRLTQMPESPETKAIALELDQQQTILVPVRKFSRAGDFRYHLPGLIKRSSEWHPIYARDILNSILTLSHWKHIVDPEQVEVILERWQESNAIIAACISRLCSRPEGVRIEPSDFAKAEQSLWSGHNFHPTPKSRTQFNAADLAFYSPEYQGQFSMQWVAIHSSILLQKNAESFYDESWPLTMLEKEGQAGKHIQKSVPAGYKPLPFHPWQLAVLQEDASMKDYWHDRMILVLGTTPSPWLPTSSVRTVYNHGHSYMLKFSLSVQLTNSIRHLYPHEVERGLQVYDVLNTPPGKEFRTSYPQATILGEPAYFGILNQSGEIHPPSLGSLRLNPFQLQDAADCIMLATLIQDDPDGQASFLQRTLIKISTLEETSMAASGMRWFEKFLSIVIEPLIGAQSNYGLLLGAHQQNIIVGLDEHGLPNRLYFRDCQGTGYSKLGYRLFSPHVASITPDNGNVLEDDIAHKLLGYYLIINTCFSTISQLARFCDLAETCLFDKLREFLLSLLNQNPNDPGFLHYLLYSSKILNKGNLKCTLEHLNENTLNDPFALYSPIDNPIYYRRTDHGFDHQL